jgi:hypothetical protein
MWVFMTEKSKTTYVSVFKELRDVFDITIESSMTDFEAAMRDGLKEVYPKIVINGCWFHYCQVCIIFSFS